MTLLRCVAMEVFDKCIALNAIALPRDNASRGVVPHCEEYVRGFLRGIKARLDRVAKPGFPSQKDQDSHTTQKKCSERCYYDFFSIHSLTVMCYSLLFLILST